MIGYEYINKIREYCDYLERHLKNVADAWNTLTEKCNDMRFIYDDFYFFNTHALILNHDLSKFTPEEFIPYQMEFFPVDEKLKKSFPVYYDINIPEASFSDAWEHHLRYNNHHWQNWTKKPNSFPDEWECHCVCMVCDWMAMGVEFGDTAQSYYEKNKDEILLPEYAVKFINEIFKRIY